MTKTGEIDELMFQAHLLIHMYVHPLHHWKQVPSIKFKQETD